MPWGWTWMDSAPWGFAPFHYGHWAYVGPTQCWVPGPVVPRSIYTPALVGFVGGGGGGGVSWGISISIGSPGMAWFPLTPGKAHRPVYAANPTYVTSINRVVVVNNVTIDKTIINNTTNITNVHNVSQVTYVGTNNPVAPTAVPARTFANGQPVGPAVTHLRPEQLRAQMARAQFVPTPALTPVRASLVGAAVNGGPHQLPPPQAFARQAIAVRAPAVSTDGHDALAERFRSQGGALPGAGPAWTGGNTGTRIAPVRDQASAGMPPAPIAAQAAGFRLSRAARNGQSAPAHAGGEPGRPPEQHGANGPQGLIDSPNPQGAQPQHGGQPVPAPQVLMAPGLISRPRPQPGAAAPRERPAQPQTAQAPQGLAGMTARPPQCEGAPGTSRDGCHTFKSCPQLPQAPQPQPQSQCGGQEPNRLNGTPTQTTQEHPHNEPPRPQMHTRLEPRQHRPEPHMEAPRPAPQPHIEMRPPQLQTQPHPPEARPPQPQPQTQPPQQEHYDIQSHPQSNRGKEKHEGEHR